MAQAPETERTKKQDLQIARSELLDAFAGAEAAIVNLEEKRGLKQNTASLGLKIGRLRKLADKAELGLDAIVLDQLTTLNEIRTEIVHRQMNVVQLHGEPQALFVGGTEGCKLPPTARVVSLSRFKAMATELKNLSNQIRKVAI